MKTTVKNLDIYGSEPLEWARAVKQLEDASGHRTCWLATTDPGGRAHIAGVASVSRLDEFLSRQAWSL
jgi:hypothetical protein